MREDSKTCDITKPRTRCIENHRSGHSRKLKILESIFPLHSLRPTSKLTLVHTHTHVCVSIFLKTIQLKQKYCNNNSLTREKNKNYDNSLINIRNRNLHCVHLTHENMLWKKSLNTPQTNMKNRKKHSHNCTITQSQDMQISKFY